MKPEERELLVTASDALYRAMKCGVKGLSKAHAAIRKVLNAASNSAERKDDVPCVQD